MENQIVILNKRAKKQIADHEKEGYLVVDVTSKSEVFKEMSPFYPVGNITLGKYTSESVEGLWQGLKVFENADIDPSKFKITNMCNLKRTTRKFGKVLGHLDPESKNRLLIDYLESRKRIYIPAYNQQLNSEACKCKIEFLKDTLKRGGKIVFLDYDTNEDINNLSKPLSHASCIKRYLVSLCLHGGNVATF